MNQVETIQWLNRRPINTKTHRNQIVLGRNDPCYCGSKKKFKHCCWSKQVAIMASTASVEADKYYKKERIRLKKLQETQDATPVQQKNN